MAEAEEIRTSTLDYESPPPTVYRGNTRDINALIAGVTGVLAILSCATMGWSVYCLPFLPLILGIIGLATARRAVNPDRARLLSWIGVGTGGVSLLIIAAFFALWLILWLIWMLFAFMMASSSYYY